MSFLCDTNIISEIMKPQPCLSVQLWFAEQDSLYLSAISVEEIIFGLEAKQAVKKLAWFKRLLNQSCEVLPVSCDIANYCGELRAALRRRGTARSQADSLIAATAYIHGKILVTRNIKDFTECNIEILNPFDDLV